MDVFSWIMLIIFGLMGLRLFYKFFNDRMNWFEVLIMTVSIFIAALSAGHLWGGLTFGL